jgi:oligopeptide/dipeptide ABC transporter ATP-binding protein
LTPSPLLEIEHLSISYHSPAGTIRAVRDASFHVSSGETVALVGESGSGKSTLAFGIVGLLDSEATIDSGEIRFENRNVASLDEREWRRTHSRKIGIIFQDSRSALNPVLTVEDHLIETIRAHQNLSRKEARKLASEFLNEVGISERFMSYYPFELSGGSCQKVGIALALCNGPMLLVADEPTSSVDATVQVQILDLLAEMKARHRLSLLLVSHDMPMVSKASDRILVMYHGIIVESGLTCEVFASPMHPYTQALMRSRLNASTRYDTHPVFPIPGAMPSPGQELPGCVFAPRCTEFGRRCLEAAPGSRQISATHWAACLRVPDWHLTI